MKPFKKEDLVRIKDEVSKRKKDWIRVGFSTCGIAAGAQEAFEVLLEEARKHNIDIDIRKTGCAGMCYAEPLVEVCVQGMPKVFYGKVNKDTAVKIIDKHVMGKMLLNDRIYDVKVDG
jgi:(2Fe-2S) ferredoxin